MYGSLLEKAEGPCAGNALHGCCRVRPEDIAALFVFLSSEDASYITGTTQNINGGAYIA